MCRYSLNGPYKSHYACFACRKAFKQPPISDWLAVRGSGFVYAELSRRGSHKPSLERREKELGVRLNDLLAEYENAAHQCPECSQPMIDMAMTSNRLGRQIRRLGVICLAYIVLGTPFTPAVVSAPDSFRKQQLTIVNIWKTDAGLSLKN